MDSYFLYLVLFSFIPIALILFILFFTDELREIKGHFKWKQYIVYLLGSLLELYHKETGYSNIGVTRFL